MGKSGIRKLPENHNAHSMKSAAVGPGGSSEREQLPPIGALGERSQRREMPVNGAARVA
jgi:hypothetical protein